MYRLISYSALVLALLITTTSMAAKDNFPGRKLFPDVQPISLEELNQNFKNVIVVDARTRYEYDTIRIVGSYSALVSKSDFEDKIRNLRERSDKPIVFYCNGHTCFKSYKAARRAQEAGIKNVLVFDAGIFHWARTYPDKAVLLGQSPVRVSDLISKKDFKKRLLSSEEFQRRTSRPDVLVLDVRSRLQRGAAGLFPFEEKFASLDNKKKLDRFINKALREKKTVLAYDAVGKQVRWFEYYLRKKGVKNYYFLEKGADGYFSYLAIQQNSSDVSKAVAKVSKK
ncbi:MAG: rhodanese-like domain-containing protein [Acidiferrobacterales bacterium]